MSSYLVALNGPDSGKKYYLTREQFTLGRHPDCDIVVEVGAVSRYHARVTRHGETGFSVEDLGSRNGTFVNEQQIAAAQMLGDGDSVRVCDVTFEFHQDEDFRPPSNTKDLGNPGAFGTVVVDDEGVTSTIMSSFEVSANAGSIHLTASPEVKLNALIEITRQLTGTLSLDDVLPRVLESLFTIFLQADRGFIIMDDGKGNMIPRWSKSRRDEDSEIRISKTIMSHVMDSREAILSADAAADSRFEMSQSITDFKIRSIMCAPLVDSEERVVGVIQIDTLDQRKRFQKEDLEVLVTVAMQAVAAIERAQMHDDAIKQIAFKRDLNAANQVQIGFLPSQEPQVAGYSFYHYYLAANSVGGDYYDYVSLSDGRVAVLVGDVVGHGIAASLMMAKLSAEARYCLASNPDPQLAMFHLNNAFTNATPSDKFVTLALAVLNPVTHEVKLVNAGHNPVMIRKPDGAVELRYEEEIGLPVGILDDMDYDLVTFTVNPGETVVIFTDGINEAMDADGNQFTMERMVEIFSQPRNNVRDAGEALIKACQQFMGDSPQFDDICMVAFHRDA